MKLIVRIAAFFLLGFLLQQPVAAQSFSYLALGDSYTIGEKVSKSNRWPVILADTLSELGYRVEDPDIVAVTGWTTSELQAGIEEAELDQSYYLVSLLIGVNNQYRGQDIDIFRHEFRQLMEQAIEFAGGRTDHVLVLSIPDYGVTPFAEDKQPAKISREIGRYNQIKGSITREYGAHFVNITPISRRAAEQPELLAEDQLHPSGTMYRMWVEQALPIVIDEIKTWNSDE